MNLFIKLEMSRMCLSHMGGIYEEACGVKGDNREKRYMKRRRGGGRN